MPAVPASHPCLDGHFPGNPIVPGVVIVDLVQAAARKLWGLSALGGMPNIKFLAPLKAEQGFSLVLTRGSGDNCRFRVEAEGQLVAQGSMQFDAEIAAA